MACSKEVYCGPCEYENTTTSATKWCTECAEGFCSDCFKGHKAVKLTRNHHVILVEDYLKTQSFAVNLTCADHDTNFDFFCPAHDKVVCVVCVQQHHSKCTGLLALADASKDVKTSTALSDLETTIEGILKNIDQGNQNLQHSERSVIDQEEAVSKIIEEKQEQINKHFDKLKKKLLSELTTNRQKCQNKLSILTTSLNEKQNHFLRLKAQVETMKNVASNRQTFLGIRTMQQNMNEEEKSVKPLIVSVPEYAFTFENDPKCHSVVDEINSFGRVQVTVKTNDQAYIVHKIAQAQFQKPIITDVDAIRLVLNKTVSLSSSKGIISDCLILPNKEMLFIDCENTNLSVYKKDGSFCRHINVKNPASKGTIIDENRIALTYQLLPAAGTIGIIDLTGGKTEKILRCLKSWGWGIAYYESKLCVYDQREHAIYIVNLNGTAIDRIRIELDYNKQLFTVLSNGLIICLNKSTIECVDNKGKTIWKCTDPDFEKIAALTNDRKGVIYAICLNCDVLAISNDGQRTQVLLRDPNEPGRLTAAHFDMDGKQLLICNSTTKTAYLYDVV